MKEEWINKIINHDVTKKFPLPDECIDVVITSPPYFGLRNYGVEDQIGLEKNPQEYIDKIVGVGQEIKRVLKKSGSFYLNLGDTYKNKNLMGIPWRVTIALQEDDGDDIYEMNKNLSKENEKYVLSELKKKGLIL